MAPVFDELKRLAAQGDVLHNDDTPAKILEHTTLADLISDPSPRSAKGKKHRHAKKKESGSVLSMVVGGNKGD